VYVVLYLLQNVVVPPDDDTLKKPYYYATVGGGVVVDEADEVFPVAGAEHEAQAESSEAGAKHGELAMVPAPLGVILGNSVRKAVAGGGARV
jgi:hypothetical protein